MKKPLVLRNPGIRFFQKRKHLCCALNDMKILVGKKVELGWGRLGEDILGRESNMEIHCKMSKRVVHFGRY